jgi:hypothetical protein
LPLTGDGVPRSIMPGAVATRLGIGDPYSPVLAKSRTLALPKFGDVKTDVWGFTTLSLFKLRNAVRRSFARPFWRAASEGAGQPAAPSARCRSQ